MRPLGAGAQGPGRAKGGPREGGPKGPGRAQGGKGPGLREGTGRDQGRGAQGEEGQGGQTHTSFLIAHLPRNTLNFEGFRKNLDDTVSFLDLNFNGILTIDLPAKHWDAGFWTKCGKGILTIGIWNAVDTANDIKQLKKEVKAIEGLERPGVLQFFLVRSGKKALREAGVEWPC